MFCCQCFSYAEIRYDGIAGPLSEKHDMSNLTVSTPVCNADIDIICIPVPPMSVAESVATGNS